MDKYARMLSNLKTSKAMERFSHFYGRREGELARQLTRCTELVKWHEDIFHSDGPLYLISASGRTELIGNHTDHNNGCVMAAAVNLDTLAAVSPRNDSHVSIHSAGFASIDMELNDTDIHEDERNTSTALIRGIAARFSQLGYRTGGFEAVITSDVPTGSGLSSSASYELMICTILNKLYNNDSVDPVLCAQISQYAENVYFGKPSGLMDQMASAVGGLVYIDFKNLPDTPDIRPLSLDLSTAGYALVVVDTHGSHDDLTDEYASIRSDMNDVAAFFGEKTLRKVRPDEFRQSLSAVREKCSDRACLRAMHFFNENDRVKQFEKAVKANDITSLLSLTCTSGRSSWELLQNIYVPGVSQPLSLALMMSEDLLRGKGAWRVHGGGFAGTILNIVPENMLDLFVRRMDTVFGNGSCHVLCIRPEGAACLFEEE